jgi:carbonic anhydrase/acetyltransferase-like protein (isoleucine patch superfamily)
MARRFGTVRELLCAAPWYICRFVRQKLLLAYVKTFGRYIFSRVGSAVVIDGLPEVLYPCSDITVGDGTRIGKRCVFQGSRNASIRLGQRVSLNDGCYLTSLYSIDIGAGTSIGEYTSIRDYNHAYGSADIPLKEQGYTGAPIRIGREVWIGRGCMILPGVEIGDGAIVGANSVVTKSVPPRTVVGGVPARVIKQIDG